MQDSNVIGQECAFLNCLRSYLGQFLHTPAISNDKCVLINANK